MTIVKVAKLKKACTMLPEDTLMKIKGRRIPPYHKVMISNGIDVTSGDVAHLVLVLVAENQRSDVQLDDSVRGSRKGRIPYLTSDK